MSTADLDTYLLNNWEDFDAAAARGNALENAVFEALADEVRRWADSRGWSGLFTVDTIWLAPPEWTTKPAPRPDADAWFKFGYHGPEEDSYGLTSLMGLNRDVAGFEFHQTRMPVRQWKPIATSPELLEALPGFSLQAARPFHPLRLERASLLDAAADGDYAHAAAPVAAVLDRLEAAVPVISRHLGSRTQA